MPNSQKRALSGRRAAALPIDTFLRSLAAAQGERAVAVILSGAGSDGAQGVREVKGRGGVVLVQEPATAGHAGMPRSAIATGAADRVGEPAALAKALLALVRGSWRDDAALEVLTFSDVAELADTQRRLTRSEAFTRLVTDTVPALVAYIDPALRYQFCNGAFQRWFGVSPEALRGRPVAEVLGEAAFARVEPHLRRALGGESVTHEALLPFARGGDRFVDASYVPDRAPDGEVAGVVALVSDVSRRRAAEAEALRLAAIVQHTQDAVIGKDLDGIITSWNAAAERTYGLTAAEAVGRPIELIVPPERRAELEDILDRVRRGEAVAPLETERVRRDGGRVQVELTVSPIWDPDGVLIGASAVARDISRRKAAERALARAEERLRLALEAAEVGSFEYDPASGAMISDERFWRIVRGGIGGDTGRDAWLAYAHPDDREALGGALATALEPTDEGALACEYRVIHTDGQTRWVQVRGRVDVAGPGDQRRASRLIGRVQDVTARREASERLEERVRERTRELVEHRERLRAMAYELSLAEQRQRRELGDELHDSLAQLLAATLIKLQQLPGTDGEGRLGEVRSLLEQALSYTRTLVAELSPSFLYDEGLVAGLHWLGDQLRRHDLTVEMDVAPRLPRVPDEATIVLFQVVRELLLNVVKHAHADRARVALRSAAGELIIEVSDRGRGFHLAAQEGQLSPPGHFGLFGVRERVEALHGTFTLRSRPGGGTTAEVRVPVQLLEATPPPPELSPLAPRRRPSSRVAPALPNEGARKALRVALVDDHDLVREGLRLTLEAQGEGALEVVGEATNGRQAIELVDRLHPDVVLMDINMPVMNGIDATREIRQRHPDVRVIGVTVHTEQPRLEAMLAAGAAAVVTKGGSAAELLAAMRAG